MGRLDGVDDAGRAVAGLLGYNPGPGIYSRLERAVEAMPANVRVQELPGLLKRYKEGVPGWELRATDLDSTIAGRDVVPRDELLAAVRERSPVHTHREIVLGGTPQQSFHPEYYTGERPSLEGQMIADFQRRPSPLGQGVSHGVARYGDYGQGGENYSELLMLQPNALGEQFASHWHGQSGAPGARAAVAHARYDTHGDALRINELQSDLGIHNRKAREYADNNPQIQFGQRLNPPEAAGLPFPMEDAWTELLIKRLALEAARKGHRAIEVASPRAIADKVGGNIDNYEHFYGKVVPGAIERLGRKMGGVTEDAANVALPPAPAQDVDAVRYAGRPEVRKLISEFQGGDEYAGPEFWKLYRELVHSGLSHEARGRVYDYFGKSVRTPRGESEIANDIYEYFAGLGHTPEAAQKITSRALMEAPRAGRLQDNFAMQKELRSLEPLLGPANKAPGRRYIMSDEMRRRLIEQGVGASLLAPLLMQGEE